MPVTVVLVYGFGPLRQWWQVRQCDDNSDGLVGSMVGSSGSSLMVVMPASLKMGCSDGCVANARRAPEHKYNIYH